MPIAIFDERTAAKVAGPEAAHFLDNLLTARTPESGGARYAALLAPQGKILADMFVFGTAEGFLLDIPSALLADLLKKLKLYRLRAKVEIAPVEELAVGIAWNGSTPPVSAVVVDDPRLPALGRRFLVTKDALAALSTVPEADWQAHRIALGIPEGGLDFAYGDAFPHEADMDQLHGIDFDKGCYVGQEIVSRMQHRGTARTRVIPFALDGATPERGTPILAGAKTIGTVGSGISGRALALVRLDRLGEALEAGQTIAAGDTNLRPEPLGWARFAIPGTEPVT